MIWRYFGSSFILTALALAVVYGVMGSWSAVYLCVVLGALELSLSFDNAIVNARVLERMSPVWQKRFIWLGIPVAVFGMRLLFPLLLVYLTTPLSFMAVMNTALYEPQHYAQALQAGYPMISAFGGAFLFMVFFHFWLNPYREVAWLRWLECNAVVRRLAKIAIMPALLTIVVGGILVGKEFSWQVMESYLLGVGTYSLLHLLTANMTHKTQAIGLQTARYGLMGFLYLEVLDASFSFDGVIGAFAISTDILIIMVGLGIGAIFVRSLTIYFVERKTLGKFVYLEHGAYYAIGCLAAIMLLKNFMHISELLSGSIGLLWIAAAVASSLLKK